MNGYMAVLFEDLSWKLAELIDAMEAAGFRIDAIRQVEADLYEVKTHLRKTNHNREQDRGDLP